LTWFLLFALLLELLTAHADGYHVAQVFFGLWLLVRAVPTQRAVVATG
jgi:hypothetical protein